MHSPALLFLDEPSTGMDPQNRANLWEHIDRLRERQQTTIVLTTHYLEEADTQAERVLVIDHGKIIADDTAPNLKATLAGDRITVTVDVADADAAAAIMAERGRELSRSDVRARRAAGGPVRPGNAYAARPAGGHAERGAGGAGGRRPGAHAGRRVPQPDRAESARRGRGGGGMSVLLTATAASRPITAREEQPVSPTPARCSSGRCSWSSGTRSR